MAFRILVRRIRIRVSPPTGVRWRVGAKRKAIAIMKTLTFCCGAPQARSPLRGVLAALAAGGLVAACAEVSLDPDEWFCECAAPADPALAERVAAERAWPVPGADGDYPPISAVPAEVPAATPAAHRRRIAESLSAAGAGDVADPAPVVAPSVPSSAVAAASGAVVAGAPAHAAVIYFGHGSVSLSEEDRAVLKRVADTQRARAVDLRVVGHASARTSGGDAAAAKIANFRVALDRARAVAGALARHGVPDRRILIEAQSDNEPAFSDATALGEAANRRTDIYFVAPADPG